MNLDLISKWANVMSSNWRLEIGVFVEGTEWSLNSTGFGSSAIGSLEWALRREFCLDLLHLEICSKFGSYWKIGNDNERWLNMHQQKLVYIYMVQKRNKMKKVEKLTSSAVRQCSSSWSATAGKLWSNVWPIDQNFDRSLSKSIDRLSAEK